MAVKRNQRQRICGATYALARNGGAENGGAMTCKGKAAPRFALSRNGKLSKNYI